MKEFLKESWEEDKKYVFPNLFSLLIGLLIALSFWFGVIYLANLVSEFLFGSPVVVF